MLPGRPPRSGVVFQDIFSTHFFFTRKPFFFTPRPRRFTMSHVNSTKTKGDQTSYKKVLTIDTINPAVLSAKYAVRGELAIRANELTAQLKKGEQTDLPFKDVVHCEIGNPQALDQKPLTFIRQVVLHYVLLIIGSCVDGIS
jgi:hypothetical protein